MLSVHSQQLTPREGLTVSISLSGDAVCVVCSSPSGYMLSVRSHQLTLREGLIVGNSTSENVE
jgi:hypothetical protein